MRARVDDLLATATRHKHEIDYTLRHWATPVERARVEDRLGSLMRVGLRLREIREGRHRSRAGAPRRRLSRCPPHRSGDRRRTLSAMPRLPTLADVNDARGRLRGIALHTPLEPSPELAEATGAAEVRLKREEVQPTGAFKTRGAHNKVALVAEARPEAALVTASSGNHGIAVATAAVRHGMRLTVLVGRSVTPRQARAAAGAGDEPRHRRALRQRHR